MRYHKRKDGRKLINGFYYSTIEVYQKVVTMAKEVSRKAVRTDIVGTQLEDGKRVKALVVARRFKDKQLQYRLSVGDKENIWLDAKNWKVIEQVKVPLKMLHKSPWKGTWKNEWSLMTSTLTVPLNKSAHNRVIRRMH